LALLFFNGKTPQPSAFLLHCAPLFLEYFIAAFLRFCSSLWEVGRRQANLSEFDHLKWCKEAPFSLCWPKKSYSNTDSR
jgi:hypothetical protein